jgi:ketosteroid isomerase-like protein
VLRGLKIFRIMRLDNYDHAVSRRQFTSADMHSSVTGEVIKLVFWLGGTIYISAGKLVENDILLTYFVGGRVARSGGLVVGLDVAWCQRGGLGVRGEGGGGRMPVIWG